MNQTSYNGVNNLIKGLPVIGGFCKYWFIPIEEVEAMPVIDPTNQVLKTDITLKAGKAWRGPVPVPDRQLGFTESKKVSASGPYYDIKVSCSYPGALPSARSNFDNMAYHQYMIVGKLRASGFYVVIGNTEAGADFSTDFDSGSANGNAVMTKIEFATEQVNKALVLPAFEGDQSGYISFPYWQIDSYNYWELE